MGVLLGLGIIFVSVGISMGAKTSIYWDAAGIHPESGDEEHQIQISELNLEPFRNISVGMVSHDIEIIISDGYGFEMVNNNNTEVAWSLQNSTLAISEKSFRKRFSLGFNFSRNAFKNRSYLKIYVPANAVLGNISVSNVSGGTEIGNIAANTLKMNSISGRLDMSNCSAQNVNINIVSGKVSISGLKSGGLYLKSISGGVDIGGELLGRSEISSVSGSVLLQISGGTGQYDKQFNLVSGRLRINGQNFSKNYSETHGAANNLKVNTVSGGVTVDFIQQPGSYDI